MTFRVKFEGPPPSVDRTVYEYCEQDSVNTPGYPLLKRLGRLPNNPYYMYHVRVTSNIVKLTDQNDRLFSAVADAWEPICWVPDPSELRARALAKHYNKVRSKDIDLSVALLELDKSINFVTQTVRSFQRSFKQAKSGNLKGALDTLKRSYSKNIPPKQARRQYWYKQPKSYSHPDYVDGRSFISESSDVAAGAYLAYANAAKPLLLDVHSLISIHEKGFSKDPADFTVKTVDTAGDYLSAQIVSNKITGHFRQRYSVVSKMRWDRVQAAAMSQLGLTSPLETAWELIPFSYIIDYFVNVSSWIASVQPPIGAKYVGTLTMFDQLEQGHWKNTSNTDASPLMEGTYLKHYKYRTVGIQPPELNPFKTFSFDLSVSQFANVLSVLRKTVFR